MEDMWFCKHSLVQKCWLTFWHLSSTFNSNKSPTWYNFSVYYPVVCLQLNMFWAFSRPSSGAQWLQCQPLVRIVVTVALCSWSGRPKVKPEAATAVIELLMMGGKTPKTCWAVNKRQDNKLKSVTLGWWFILIVRWCTDLQTLNFTYKF